MKTRDKEKAADEKESITPHVAQLPVQVHSRVF